MVSLRCRSKTYEGRRREGLSRESLRLQGTSESPLLRPEQGWSTGGVPIRQEWPGPNIHPHAQPLAGSSPGKLHLRRPTRQQVQVLSQRCFLQQVLLKKILHGHHSTVRFHYMRLKSRENYALVVELKTVVILVE